MKNLIVCVALASMLGACAASTESDSTTSTIGQDQTTLRYVVPGGTESGIAGNRILVAIVEDRVLSQAESGALGGAYGRMVKVGISYVDEAKFFAGAQELNPYVGVRRDVNRKSGGRALAVENMSSGIVLKKLAGRNQFEGYMSIPVTGQPGDSSARLLGLDLAFNAQTKWDSNSNRNYTIVFPAELQSDSNDKTVDGVLRPR